MTSISLQASNFFEIKKRMTFSTAMEAQNFSHVHRSTLRIVFIFVPNILKILKNFQLENHESQGAVRSYFRTRDINLIQAFHPIQCLLLCKSFEPSGNLTKLITKTVLV